LSILPDDLRIQPGLTIPIHEVEIRTSRSSGPGGQHANVTASRVEASIVLANSTALSERQRARLRARFGPRVTASAQDTRSQLRNRELALERLRTRIEQALRVQKPRRPTKPSRAANQKRLTSKRQRGQLKQGRRAAGDEH
jgi:ribosome-associated protein